MDQEFCVYILFSKNNGKYYTGFTSDLINRIHSHNKFSNKGYTNKFRPWIVIHVEIFYEKKSALKREKWFKTGVGREFIKTLNTQ